jgi:two-component system OmpR family response regulator
MDRSSSSPEAPRQRPLRVLLIEDSPLIRRHLVALLEDNADINVTGEVDTEAAAIAALDSTVFDAAVVDLQLREGSGFGVLQHLHAHTPTCSPSF